MASKRMFSKTIIDSDAFLDMPFSAQALYVHLSMNADDDGFINSPKMIQRQIGASADDLATLIEKRFLLAFDSGVVVVKHWWINNTIRTDRRHDTVYGEELSQLIVKDNNAYTLKDGKNANEMTTKCQPNDNQMSTKEQQKHAEPVGKTEEQKAADARRLAERKAHEQAVEDNFEALWRIYPRKKGKGQVNKKAKQIAYDIGYEKYAEMIEAYKRDLAGTEEQYMQYGSTFFNSGYLDYMDNEPKAEPVDDKFANYQ